MAFVINPFTKTIAPIDYDGDYNSIFPHLGRDVEGFEGVVIVNGNSVYVDGNGLFKDRQAYFQMRLGDSDDKDHYYPMAGNGFVLGTDGDGYSIDPTITLEDLRDRIIWGIE